MYKKSCVVGWVVVGCWFLGCVIHGDEHKRYEVEVSWKLNGLNCDADSDVQTIRLSFSEDITDGKTEYPCSQNGKQGVVIKRVFPGTYDYTAEALDSERRLLYSAKGFFEVGLRGNNAPLPVEVNFSPLVSDILLYWSLMEPGSNISSYQCREFPAGMLGEMVVRIDGVEKGRFRCKDGEYAGFTVTIPGLKPGKRLVEVEAEVAGREPFRGSERFTNYERNDQQTVWVKLYQ